MGNWSVLRLIPRRAAAPRGPGSTHRVSRPPTDLPVILEAAPRRVPERHLQPSADMARVPQLPSDHPDNAHPIEALERHFCATRLSLAILVATSAMPLAAAAQSVDQVATVPPNVVLANYDNVPVGPFGGLEGPAYVARVSDPSAAWFNPAGLARQTSAQISGSAGAYQWTAVSPQALPNRGGSAQQLPNYVGFTFRVRERLTAGAALLTTNSWIQEIDSQLITSVPTGQERFAYSADSTFTQRVGAVGAGYESQGPWRVGGGLAFSLVRLRLVQGISDRVAHDTGLDTLLVAARASGSSLQLRAQGGVQYETPLVHFGAAVRTPGLTMHREGVVTLDGTLSRGAASLGGSLFDADALFEYRLPWELQAGAAYIRDRVVVEVDLQGYTSIAAHALLATDQPTLIYGDAGTGSPPSVILRPFGGLTSESDGVVNVSVGGHVQPLRHRSFQVHGGFATSRSPVGAADQVFNKVDLSSWTAGVSGAVARFQFALGFNWRLGTTSDVLVRNLLNGDPIRTPVDIRTGGFIYSVAYQF